MSMKFVHECDVCVSCGVCSFLYVCSALHISSTRDECHVCVAVCCSVLQCVAVCCSDVCTHRHKVCVADQVRDRCSPCC